VKSGFDLNMTTCSQAQHSPLYRIECHQKANKYGNKFEPLNSGCYCYHPIHDSVFGFRMQDYSAIFLKLSDLPSALSNERYSIL
jgi:hypothetical protein